MIFEIDKIENKTDIYKLMSQTIIPRPIAWIVTENKGVVNIAPFSYFTGLSSNPATILVSVGHKKDGTPKDTLKNIRETKKCVVCMVTENNLQKMHFSSKELPTEISEMERFNIKTKKILDNFPPLIEDVPCAYFCELNQEINLGGNTIPLILNLKQILIKDENIKDKNDLTIKYNPIARIGKSYAYLGEEITPAIIPE